MLGGCGATANDAGGRAEDERGAEGTGGTSGAVELDGSLLRCADAARECWSVDWERQLTFGERAIYRGATVTQNGRLVVAGVVDAGFPDTATPDASDTVVAAFNLRGDEAWAEAYDFGPTEYPVAAASDAEGHVLVLGNSTPSEYSSIPFLAKLGPGSMALWSVVLEDGPIEVAEPGLAVDRRGNIYIAGWTARVFRNSGSVRGAVLKFDSDGGLLWTHEIHTDYANRANGLALDAEGQLVVAAEIAVSGNVEQVGALVRKLDENGNELWTTLLDTTRRDYALDVAVDATGRVVVAGVTEGELAGTWAGGSFDAFVVQLDAGGGVSWIHQWGGEDEERIHDVEVTPGGRIYVLGSVSDVVYDSDPDLSSEDPNPLATAEGFLYEIDDRGIERRPIALRMSDGSFADFPSDMALDPSGNLHVVGSNFDDETGLAELNGKRTGFILRLEPTNL